MVGHPNGIYKGIKDVRIFPVFTSGDQNISPVDICRGIGYFGELSWSKTGRNEMGCRLEFTAFEGAFEKAFPANVESHGSLVSRL